MSLANGQARVFGGRYTVGEMIGRGGMGAVHRGRDLRLGRDVAIKMLRANLAQDAVPRQRFRREAQHTAALNHPAIVTIYDTGEEHGPDAEEILYIVMELVEGRTLKEVLAAEGRLIPRRALEITADICAALEFSHRHGIIHRDVKPGNVILTRTGQVKVADFGIARALAAGASTMTQTSAVVGSAHYMAPEQARGEAVDARTDVYATGCVLYHLICGVPPFDAENVVDVAYQHVREDPRPASGHTRDVSPTIDAVVLKALAKNPANRYQSAGEMRADLLRAAAGRPVMATPVMRDDERTAMSAPQPAKSDSVTRPVAKVAPAPPPTPPANGPGRSYASFVQKLGQTTTITAWRWMTMNQGERLGDGAGPITSVSSDVRGWVPPTTKDLEVRVYATGERGDGHIVTVRGTEGEAEESIRLPANLDEQLARVSSALDTARLSPSLSTSEDETAVEALGSTLFETLFPGDVGRLYHSCSVAASSKYASYLRLVLRFRSPKLAVLPWELMFDPSRGAYLSLIHPIVRYVEMALPLSGLEVRPPLYVLGMVASPDDMPPLSIAEERAAVEDALSQLIRDGLVRLTWVNGQTWQDFQRKLYKRQYHALHFVAHGGFDDRRQEGHIVFADRSGRPDRVSASDLGATLAGQHQLRLAVLNTCESARGDGRRGYASTAEALVRKGVNAVLAMREAVSDPAAHRFASVFYDAVSAALPIDVAAMTARLAVKREERDCLEWATPVVYMRSTNASLLVR